MFRSVTPKVQRVSAGQQPSIYPDIAQISPFYTRLQINKNKRCKLKSLDDHEQAFPLKTLQTPNGLKYNFLQLAICGPHSDENIGNKSLPRSKILKSQCNKRRNKENRLDKLGLLENLIIHETTISQKESIKENYSRSFYIRSKSKPSH